MNLKDLRRVSSQNQDVDVLSRALQDWASQLQANPMLNGVLIKDVALTTSPKLVPHSLGQKWQGFVITNKNVPSAGIGATRSPTTDQLSIQLTATASVTVDLWVF